MSYSTANHQIASVIKKVAEHVFVQLYRLSMCKQHLMSGHNDWHRVYTPALLSLMVISSHGFSIAGNTDLNTDDVLSST